MHAFKGEHGLRFHYSSDFSGDVIISREGMPWWTARFPVADILAFAAHARGLIEAREAQQFANELIRIGAAVPVVEVEPDDRLNITDW